MIALAALMSQTMTEQCTGAQGQSGAVYHSRVLGFPKGPLTGSLLLGLLTPPSPRCLAPRRRVGGSHWPSHSLVTQQLMSSQPVAISVGDLSGAAEPPSAILCAAGRATKQVRVSQQFVRDQSLICVAQLSLPARQV